MTGPEKLVRQKNGSRRDKPTAKVYKIRFAWYNRGTKNILLNEVKNL